MLEVIIPFGKSSGDIGGGVPLSPSRPPLQARQAQGIYTALSIWVYGDIMAANIRIQKLKGGYIVREGAPYIGQEEIIVTTDELFERLLLAFEGRSDTFIGDKYGKVVISREEPK